MRSRMLTSVLTYLWNMSLPLAAFPASMSCQKIARVAGAMKKWKRERNMSLNQW